MNFNPPNDFQEETKVTIKFIILIILNLYYRILDEPGGAEIWRGPKKSYRRYNLLEIMRA